MPRHVSFTSIGPESPESPDRVHRNDPANSRSRMSGINNQTSQKIGSRQSSTRDLRAPVADQNRAAMRQKVYLSNLDNSDGWTSLGVAINNGDVTEIKKQIKAGANIHNVGNGRTAAYLAATKGHHDIVSMLFKYGANYNGLNQPLDRKQKHQLTVSLFKAINNVRLDKIKLCCRLGADVDKSFDGVKPVELAINTGSSDAVKILFQLGAKPEARYITLAISNNNIEMVKVLRHLGVDSKSALNVATKNGYFKIAAYLLDTGAKVSSLSSENRQALLKHFQRQGDTTHAKLLEYQHRASRYTDYTEEPFLGI